MDKNQLIKLQLQLLQYLFPTVATVADLVTAFRQKNQQKRECYSGKSSLSSSLGEHDMSHKLSE